MQPTAVMTSYRVGEEGTVAAGGTGRDAGIGGRCDPRFTAVRDEFAANFTHRGETGAAARRPSRFGLGFQLTQPERPLGPGPRAFGHFGAGGPVGFADPEAGVGFGYVTSQMGPRWRNPRNRALIDAVFACL
jgi:CubicO group peptidase (beta-lactamase class C family)